MKKEQDSRIGRIKIKNIAQICMGICIILLVLIFFGIAHVMENYNNLIESSNKCVEGQKRAISLERSSDYLTDEVRMFVVNQDIQHMNNYFLEIDSKNREKMVRELEAIYGNTDEEAVEQLKKALHESNELEKQEVHAMKLIVADMELAQESLPVPVAEWKLTKKEKSMSKLERRQKSYRLVYSREYMKSKQLIEGEVEYTLSLLESKMQLRQKENGSGLKKTLIRLQCSTFLMMVLVCAILILIIVLIVYPVTEHVRSIRSNKPWKDIGGYEIRYLADIYNKLYSKNKMYREELKYKAEHDTLTGICNREVFQQRQDILKNKEVDIALLLVDIDEFKQVNDSRGHAVGDEALRRVAAELRDISIDERYCVARIGGDEFAIILLQMTIDDFPKIDAEIRKLNELLKDGDELLPPMSVSAGVAFSHKGYTEDLFHKADRALYHTKHNGRRGCSLYNEYME